MAQKAGYKLKTHCFIFWSGGSQPIYNCSTTYTIYSLVQARGNEKNEGKKNAMNSRHATLHPLYVHPTFI